LFYLKAVQEALVSLLAARLKISSSFSTAIAFSRLREPSSYWRTDGPIGKPEIVFCRLLSRLPIGEQMDQ
jgi:hypothetical protein